MLNDDDIPGYTWVGTPDQFTYHKILPWVRQLPKNKKIYCALWCTWENLELPSGYDYYILLYHVENVNLSWIETSQQKTNGKYIVLFPGNEYNNSTDNIKYIGFPLWDHDCNYMIKWWGKQPVNHKRKYKFSAVCNRATQSKIWVTGKLLEHAKEDSLLVLNSWYEDKNVHNWELTGFDELDNITKIFKEKWQYVTLEDDFDPNKNTQRYNSNPWQSLYTDAALHFTNGSFHYSAMTGFTYPGPDIDEKTLKCLVGGTGFVACGQFEIYKTLEKLGLKFDYGFDTSWDNDSGNLTRFSGIINLIDDLSKLSVDEIYQLTKESNEYNQQQIYNGTFAKNCELQRQQAIDQVMENIQ